MEPNSSDKSMDELTQTDRLYWIHFHFLAVCEKSNILITTDYPPTPGHPHKMNLSIERS